MTELHSTHTWVSADDSLTDIQINGKSVSTETVVDQKLLLFAREVREGAWKQDTADAATRALLEDLLEQQIVSGDDLRLNIVRLLGQGGMSLVLQICVESQRAILHNWALKIESQRDGKYKEYAERQRSVASAPVIHFSRQSYTLMDHLFHPSLYRELHSIKYMPFEKAIRLATFTADAIADCERGKVAHLDPKPSNLLVKHVPNTDIPASISPIDFDLSRFFSELDALQREHAEQQSIMGTSPYMSPEHIVWRYGPLSDSYSLAQIIHQICKKETVSTQIARRGSAQQPDKLVVQDVIYKTNAPELYSAARDGMPEHLTPLLPVLKALLKKQHGSRIEASKAADMLREIANDHHVSLV